MLQDLQVKCKLQVHTHTHTHNCACLHFIFVLMSVDNNNVVEDHKGFLPQVLK